MNSADYADVQVNWLTYYGTAWYSNSMDYLPTDEKASFISLGPALNPPLWNIQYAVHEMIKRSQQDSSIGANWVLYLSVFTGLVTPANSGNKFGWNGEDIYFINADPEEAVVKTPDNPYLSRPGAFFLQATYEKVRITQPGQSTSLPSNPTQMWPAISYMLNSFKSEDGPWSLDLHKELTLSAKPGPTAGDVVQPWNNWGKLKVYGSNPS